MNLSTQWLPKIPTGWQIANPKSLFSERNQKSTVTDIHLTPSQKYGVLPQSEYMEITSGSVVLNLTGSDNMKHVEKNDFIIHLRSFQGGIEHSNYSGKVSNAYCVLRPNREIEPRFFRWVLKSQGYIQELNATTDQLRDGQSIKFEQFASIGLPLPPIEEQRRIAEYLDKQMSQFESLIELKTRQIDKNRQLVGSEFAEIFLKPTQNSIPLKRLLLDEQIGIWGDEPGENELDLTVARVSDFNRLTFTLDDATTIRSVTRNQFKSRKVSKGDLLLERSGGGEKSPVGCAVYVTKDIEYLVSSNFVSRLRPAPNVSGRYLSFLFAALYMTGQQTPHSSQTTGIQNLDTESYFQTKVPQLDLEQQIKLTEKAEKILFDVSHVNSRIESSIEKYRELRISIIASAVNGEVVNREGMSK
jgi:type I restriction enzyme S subunit